MQGPLKKMLVRLADPVQYRLLLGEEFIELNSLLGKPLKLEYTGRIYCVGCNKITRKSFNQGYCYPCFIKLAECDQCIVKPELCHFAAGTCRDPEWGKSFCFQQHVVYLANSSGIKVGITRQGQIPARWIDQGAVQALQILAVPSRYVSGLVEIALGKYVSDKTHWQKMLKNQIEPVDLPAKRDALLALCEPELAELRRRFGEGAIVSLSDARPVSIQYPAIEFPTTIQSFNFDKVASVSGVLLGIKGQYLIFDGGVINVRKFTGYEVCLTI